MRAFRSVEVVHAFPDPATGVMRCCGLHRLEVDQADRATLTPADVTCDGTRRYRKDRPRSLDPGGHRG